MSVLYLVRHGQASYGAADYDRLSSRGEAQAHALGVYWARLGLVFDRCWVGPRARHRKTHELAMAAYREAGGAPPATTLLAELDEHDGQELLSGAPAPAAAGASEKVVGTASARTADAVDAGANGRGKTAAPATPERATADPAARREELRTFRRRMRRWARGELATPDGYEPWSSFRRRVVAGVERMATDGGRGAAVVAFTSGGPVASAAGLALGLGDEEVMELSWWLRNGSVSEFRFQASAGRFVRDRFTLIAYNATTHLDDPDLLTHI